MRNELILRCFFHFLSHFAIRGWRSVLLHVGSGDRFRDHGGGDGQGAPELRYEGHRELPPSIPIRLSDTRRVE